MEKVKAAMAHNKKDGVLPPPTCSSAGDGRYYGLESVSVPQEKVERVDTAVVDVAPAPLTEPVPMIETVAFEPTRSVAVIETRVVEPQPVVPAEIFETTVVEERADRCALSDDLSPMAPAVPIVNPVIPHEPIVAARK